ncbi:MAG: 16S rRNA (cytidine(1402)-2'-O)-methyltransferase [Thermoanaerobaculales bacterium]
MATPIGNLGDFSPRAHEVLATVAVVLAEDTRRVRKLLNHFAITTRVRTLHEHNEEQEVPRLLTELAAGRDLGLVSDAGTPLLSDPGYRLVRACREAGFAVLAVPGASAVAAALAVAGVPPVPFTFAGFLPARAAGRTTFLARLAPLPHSLVLFLSPHRLAVELDACAQHLGGGREAVLLAELTKVYERCERGTLAGVAKRMQTALPRGEYTLVVGPPSEPAVPTATETAVRAALDDALSRGLSLAEARREVARRFGIPRREVYRLLTPQGSR